MQDWVVDTVRSLGPAGVALLMFVENVFPPLPSELIMPLAGYLSVNGSMSFAGTVVAGTVGSLFGTTLWYWLGRRIGEDQLRDWLRKYGVYLALRPGDVRRVQRFFDRYGAVGVIVGRTIPGVRTLISLPAGLGRMSFPKFLACSAVGIALWTAGLAYAGRLLGRHFPAVGDYVGIVAWVVLVLGVVWYVVRVARIVRSGGDTRAIAAARS